MGRIEKAVRTAASLVTGAAISALVALVVGLALSPGPPSDADGAVPARHGPDDRALLKGAGPPASLDPPGYSPDTPVLDGSFADPSVIEVAGTYYAYGTNNADATVPVAIAPAPTGPWRPAGDGLAHLPAWAVEGRTWAPEVVPPRDGSQTYLLYFTARVRGTDHQCIGVATATSPAGPFVPVEEGPLVCPRHLGGAIDPASYIEPDGTRYLLFKTDDRETAAIYLVSLNRDGLSVADEPTQILARGPEEPVLVEAPELVRRHGKYVLFYSAGWFFTPQYQTRYAVASSIEGPYEKAAAPLQSTEAYRGRVEGPGSADVLTDDTGDYLVFHGILDYHADANVTRGMYIARLGWDGARPVVQGIPVRHEAERARMTHCAPASARADASGGAAAGPFPHGGCRVELRLFAPAAGWHPLDVRYSNVSGGDAELRMWVNGRPAGTLRLPAVTGTAWGSATANVALAAGWNTLVLQGKGDGQIHLDYVEMR
ncbi:MAG TPA: family 43 glycosylhydrolase [Spirillospora sp.]